jgi:hypothetical protein
VDEKGFISFMKKKRKTKRTIDTCIENTEDFKAYLESNGKSLDIATAQDLEAFAQDHVDKKRVSKFMWALSYYFEFINDKTLLKSANRIRGGKAKVARKPFKLKDFRGVHADHAAALAALGIADIVKMLEVGKTPELRRKLAQKIGLEVKVIDELVKLSDLARIPGVKGIRARLYFDAGFDLLDNLRHVTSDKLLQITREFVETTGFDGIAPLPKEALSAIETAKKLPDVVEW